MLHGLCDLRLSGWATASSSITNPTERSRYGKIPLLGEAYVQQWTSFG